MGDERRDLLVADVRRLADQARTDIGAFRDLTRLLLDRTVLADGEAGPRAYYARGFERTRGELGGMRDVLAPLRLRDGRYLRLAISLYVENTDQGLRLKASKSSFQYQASLDPDTNEWIFRYDYLRDPHGRWPSAHVQIRGDLRVEGILPDAKPLEKVHFPTDRVPLEGVIRLLVEDFDVPSAEPPETWRPMLAASEDFFKQIAHRPQFGPAN